MRAYIFLFRESSINGVIAHQEFKIYPIRSPEQLADPTSIIPNWLHLVQP